MGCGCGSKKAGARSVYVVVMPSGRQKSFASEKAAKGEVARNPGAYLKTATPTPA